MNSIGHYRASRKDGAGKIVSVLSVLPDMFVVTRKIVPIPAIKRFCLTLHNTDKGVKMAHMANPWLGKAFNLHKKQDEMSHDYTYSYADLIPRDSVMLLSGGLDSVIQWTLLGKPKAIYFDIHHKARDKELESVNRLIAQNITRSIHIDHSLSELGKHELPSGFIPYRNLLFIMMASLYSPNIIIAQISEWAPDKNKQFYNKAEKLLHEISKGAFQGINIKPRILAPFAHLTKTQLIREYLDAGFSKNSLLETVSCYSGLALPCGQCNACVARFIAMTNNGISEQYTNTPEVSKFIKKLSVKDFKLAQVPMYIKRYREYQEFRRKL